MNIFKKLFAKSKKQNNKENKTWFNDKTNTYDPKESTPNGEAYISPNSVVIQVSNYIKHS